MGGFNLPMFLFFLLVTALVAIPLLIWSELSTWIVLLAAPITSCVAIHAFGFVVDFIEGSQEPYNRPHSGDLDSLKKAEEEHLVLPQEPEGLLCPSCGSESIATILYGLPAMSKNLEKAIENREATLGGCLVHAEAPQWTCNRCNHKFGRLRSDILAVGNRTGRDERR